MKEELEKLGFDYFKGSFRKKITINSYIEITNINEVWLNSIYKDTIYLFPYNFEKVKQLIKLLS